MKKLLVAAIGTTIAILLALIPYDTVFVPEWRLRIVDTDGRPCKGHYVSQYCTNYTLGIHPCEGINDGTQISDEEGYVTFPARKIRANLAFRIARPIFGLGLLLANGEYGTNGYVGTTGACGSKQVDYHPGGTLPESIVVSSE